jgi:regulator of protease activity HflC (stomatin/prohibitin superfamily)
VNSSNLGRFAKIAVGLVALYLVGYVGFWQWGICRIEVPPGQSLKLRYKGPFPFALGRLDKADGTLVKLDASGRPSQIGILEDMPGPGRHFYNPLEFQTELVPDIIVKPGQIGIVTSKVGKNQTGNGFLVDNEGEQGVWRKVLTPGRYRLNNYAYVVELVDADACLVTRAPGTKKPGDATDATLIPPGYVGVVTNRTDNPLLGETQGIQDNVLQPGIYFINPEEKRVQVISIGFNETTQMVKTSDGSSTANRGPGLADRLGKTTGKDPEYLPDSGIEFPSNDGFPIHLDYTAIWGILPDQAPDIVRQFGTLKDVEQKVILPQIGSICRLHGSKRGAVDLLVGDTREEFQTDTSEELERVLDAKNLTLLFGLTRHIYVPNQVREPIQKARIADELTRTREQEQLTAKAQADLSEAKAKVVQEQDRTKAETEKMIAQVTAEGEKKAKEIDANTERLKAGIDAKTAIVQAEITKTIGEASAKTIELTNQAEAERYRQYVSALGGPDAYNRYVFAEGLSKELHLGVFYAGPGTFWTDLKGFEQVMLGKLADDSLKKASTPVVTRSSPDR